MPVAAYLMSVLARQLGELGADFTRRYAEPWLVWEPGPWRPALTPEARDLQGTDPPGKTAVPKPDPDDGVCYQLPPPAPGQQLSVGRASTNDIILNDTTAARHQLVVEPEDGGWRVTVTRGEVTLGGRRLEPGGWHRFRSGDQLSIGELCLTYLDAPALVDRLAGVRPAKPSPRWPG